jgi:hypothetical protein
MNTTWTSYRTWVGHFDILGFKDRINNPDQTLLLEILKSSIDEVINDLQGDIQGFEDVINYTAYADTFIIYSRESEGSGYPQVDMTSKSFLNTCVLNRLPVRGAISYGELILGHNNRTIMGKAFLESHEYGEDQNWVGLILTPSASSQLKSMGTDPINNGFINRDIPLRKFSIFDEDVYAYRFINGGSTNFQYQLLPILNEMLQRAPNTEKVKYMNTIRFIERHYPVSRS